jgi:hypothetical protein
MVPEPPPPFSSSSCVMASSITNVATTITLMPILEKLTNNNHTLWLTQVLAVLHGAHLAGYLDETSKAPAEMLKIKKSTKESEEEVEVPNPTIELWKAQEQHVLCYLLTSFSRDVLVQVAVLPFYGGCMEAHRVCLHVSVPC